MGSLSGITSQPDVHLSDLFMFILYKISLTLVTNEVITTDDLAALSETTTKLLRISYGPNCE